jgi:hypothetical protein
MMTYHRDAKKSLAQEPPPMSERYHVVSTQDSPSALDSSALADVLAKDGQLLLPMLDLIENAECALDDLTSTSWDGPPSKRSCS